MKWYHWMWAPVLVLIAFVAYLAGRRSFDVSEEFDAFDARVAAGDDIKKNGPAAAVATIEERYQDKIARLDADAKNTMDKLRRDPIALADWLSRI